MEKKLELIHGGIALAGVISTVLGVAWDTVFFAKLILIYSGLLLLFTELVVFLILCSLKKEQEPVGLFLTESSDQNWKIAIQLINKLKKESNVPGNMKNILWLNDFCVGNDDLHDRMEEEELPVLVPSCRVH